MTAASHMIWYVLNVSSTGRNFLKKVPSRTPPQKLLDK